MLFSGLVRNFASYYIGPYVVVVEMSICCSLGFLLLLSFYYTASQAYNIYATLIMSGFRDIVSQDENFFHIKCLKLPEATSPESPSSSEVMKGGPSSGTGLWWNELDIDGEVE